MNKNIGFVLFTFVLILITGCSMGSVAMCQPGGSVKVDEQYYGQLEEEYMEEVRGLLEEAGLVHAGVTLTHVREEDGTRIYTLHVHHRSYSCLNQEERDGLSRALAECAFETERCAFIQEIEGDGHTALLAAE